MVKWCMKVDVIYSGCKKDWRHSGVTARFVRSFIQQVDIQLLKRVSPLPYTHLCVCLACDAQVQELNRLYRHKDRATNILSFPDTCDMIVAYGTVYQEAHQQNKPFLNHVRHLLLHGALHLAGYDHETDEQAVIMEHLEIDILLALEIPNPYAHR